MVSGGYCESYAGQSTVCPEVLSTGEGTGSPFTYAVKGLLPGVRYYVNVVPYTSLGYGYSRPTTPASMVPPFQFPSAPRSPFHSAGAPELHVVSKTELAVKWGGPHVQRW